MHLRSPAPPPILAEGLGPSATSCAGGQCSQEGGEEEGEEEQPRMKKAKAAKGKGKPADPGDANEGLD